MEENKARIAAVRTYFREVVGEMYKVVWPSWARTAKLTGVVVGMVFVIAGFLSMLDYPLGLGMSRFLGR